MRSLLSSLLGSLDLDSVMQTALSFTLDSTLMQVK
jgi:hypothetical protein